MRILLHVKVVMPRCPHDMSYSSRRRHPSLNSRQQETVGLLPLAIGDIFLRPAMGTFAFEASAYSLLRVCCEIY